MTRTAIVTGAAGFIGCHVALRLLADGWDVVGLDNLSSYYDPRLKQARLDTLVVHDRFTFHRLDVASTTARDSIAGVRADVVIHLAAQAGVRHSLNDPDEYVRTNISGFLQVLEACRRSPVQHLVYASSSSVYGANASVPFRECDPTDHPVSLYGATKKAGEVMAYAYSHLFGIPATGLRFFTVYGPMGRPDMAYYTFCDAYFRGDPLILLNQGDLENDIYRDFTFIDDIVEGVVRVIAHPPDLPVPHRVFNIGTCRPVRLMEFVGELERALSTSLRREVHFLTEFRPVAPGDVRSTWASTAELQEAVGFAPSTRLADGLRRFTDWYVTYNRVA